MKKPSLLITLLIGVAGLAVSCATPPPPPAPSAAPSLAPTATALLAPDRGLEAFRAAGPHCDPTLWQHVYAGDPRRFSKPQDRLHVLKDCVEVTGVIDSAQPEADGDYHVRLKLDPQYAFMLNAKNMSGQHGHLVVEPVCENDVTQRDTLKEGVCNNYEQQVYDSSLLHKRVRVIGVWVTDMEHGWNEIHPVTSITPL